MPSRPSSCTRCCMTCRRPVSRSRNSSRSSSSSNSGVCASGKTKPMGGMGRQYLKTPYYGSRRMTAWLRAQGHQVNRKRVRRLMRAMGLGRGDDETPLQKLSAAFLEAARAHSGDEQHTIEIAQRLATYTERYVEPTPRSQDARTAAARRNPGIQTGFLDRTVAKIIENFAPKIVGRGNSEYETPLMRNQLDQLSTIKLPSDATSPTCPAETELDPSRAA